MKIDIKEILTLPTNTMLAIVIASGMIIFTPSKFLKQLYLIDFRDEYGSIIGAVFLLMFAILIVNLLYKTAKSISNEKDRKISEVNRKKKLKDLPRYQKAIVYGLYIENGNPVELPMNDGNIRELEHWYIIGKATTTYYTENINNPILPYILQPWVRDELLANEELLQAYRMANKEANDQANGRF
jgi:cbb3-type cytochrome oxidase subunit 3